MNKQSRLPLGSVIGSLGGGQLGRMLSLSASQLGFKTHIYDPDFNAPAKQVTNLSSTFKYDDINNLKNFWWLHRFRETLSILMIKTPFTTNRSPIIV